MQVLEESTAFLTVGQLAAELTTAGHQIGLATVYRAVNALHQNRELDSVTLADGQLAYRLCNPVHHHHLRCTKCGTTVELAGEFIEEWAQQVGEANGFTSIEHTIELTGTCGSCS